MNAPFIIVPIPNIIFELFVNSTIKMLKWNVFCL